VISCTFQPIVALINHDLLAYLFTYPSLTVLTVLLLWDMFSALYSKFMKTPVTAAGGSEDALPLVGVAGVCFIH